jgi:hypothetical protein
MCSSSSSSSSHPDYAAVIYEEYKIPPIHLPFFKVECKAITDKDYMREEYIYSLDRTKILIIETYTVLRTLECQSPLKLSWKKQITFHLSDPDISTIDTPATLEVKCCIKYEETVSFPETFIEEQMNRLVGKFMEILKKYFISENIFSQNLTPNDLKAILTGKRKQLPFIYLEVRYAWKIKIQITSLMFRSGEIVNKNE